MNLHDGQSFRERRPELHISNTPSHNGFNGSVLGSPPSRKDYRGFTNG